VNRVRVVGAGVSGLTCAHELLRAGFEVSLVARDRTPHTTSDIAGAVFYPYRAEPRDRVTGWAKASFARFAELCERPESGVSWLEMTEFFGEPTGVPMEDPWWNELVADFARLPADQVPEQFADGFRFRVPRIEMNRYMPFLERTVLDLGATIEGRALDALEDAFDGCDLIVNCSGLGARELVADGHVFPIRGQIVRVDQCGIDRGWIAKPEVHGELISYVVPREHDVILGATAEDDVGSRVPDDAATAEIIARCVDLEPRLAGCSIESVVVGLRPGRDEVRLERVEVTGRPVVHDYGHGGAGVSLSWGCAEEVLGLVGG